MTRTVSKTGTRQRCVSWGVVLALVGYFLNLCTLNPLVHADTLHQLGPSQAAIPTHCKQSSRMTFPSPPFADHGTTPEPFCCEVRGGQNKALSSSFAYTDVLPLFGHFLSPLDARSVVGTSVLQEVHALHVSRPPPLYLLHAIFLL
ncbi:MAG: hypothetical protein AB7G75_24375 [Candidatus Binatia bacterium]